MQCPRCGFDLSQVSAAACPNCGLPLAQPFAPAPSGSSPTLPGQPGQPQPAGTTNPYGVPPGEAYPTPVLPYDVTATPGQSVPPGYPPVPYPPYPGAGPVSAPLMPGQTGQMPPPGTPPGYPAYPGYPPYPGYPSWGPQSQWLLPGQPQPPKRRTGLLIGSLLAVVVILAGATIGFALLESSRQSPPIAAATATAAGPAATATPTVIYSNTFASSADGWSSDQNCFLGPSGYHVIAAVCLAPPPLDSVTDADISVQAEQTSGDTSQPYGIAFRHAGTDKRYDFMIDAAGDWWLEICTGESSDSSANCHNLTTPALASNIHSGLNTFNSLEADFQGSQFTFFINGSEVGTASDSTYSAGGIGLAGGFAGASAVFVFQNLSVTGAS
jgi:hypothetical protein